MARRIIVPLDRSEVAEAAVPVARGLARQLDLPITLVSVLEVPRQFAAYFPGQGRSETRLEGIPRDAPVSTASPYGRWTGWTSQQPSERQLNRVAKETAEAEQYLRKIAGQFEGMTVEVTVQYGSPADGILHTSERRDDSPIVIASHGRSGIGRALLGSVATRVVQASAAPVFVVRGGADLPGDTYEVHNVLAPVDGSGYSEFAVKAAIDMFGSKGLSLHLLHSVQDPEFAEKAHAEEYLRWLAERCGTESMTVTTEVCEGRPDSEINRVAADRNVDLIVLATHGHTGVDRFVLGSVAERVLRNAERPLMMVRPSS
jgi:nucleotide-binding universal stress UspA family protein